mmetsp:Transcript_17705/g.31239  ORF Transcript_17705/g.31239 Transcript_17705/m.31239 type:complete len:373 (+) Transcript_17705:135-1253(+)
MDYEAMIDEDALMELDEEPEEQPKPKEFKGKSVKESASKTRTRFYPSLDKLPARSSKTPPAVELNRRNTRTDNGTGVSTVKGGQRKSLYPTLPPARSSKLASASIVEKKAVDAGAGAEHHREADDTVREQIVEKRHAPDGSLAKSDTEPGSIGGAVLGFVSKLLSSSKERADASTSAKPDDSSDDESSDQDEAIGPHTLESDELAKVWYEVLEQVGLPKHDAERYALGFSENGIDDSNANILTDTDLEEHGISNPEHRKIILHLIRAFWESQHPDALVAGPAAAGQAPSTVDWQDVKAAEQSLGQEIARIDQMESKIAKILAGDTDRQRAFRARLATERANREAERDERRRQHKLRKAKRTVERVKHSLEHP